MNFLLKFKKPDSIQVITKASIIPHSLQQKTAAHSLFKIEYSLSNIPQDSLYGMEKSQTPLTHSPTLRLFLIIVVSVHNHYTALLLHHQLHRSTYHPVNAFLPRSHPIHQHWCNLLSNTLGYPND